MRTGLRDILEQKEKRAQDQKFSNDLIEAYKGYYEDEFDPEVAQKMKELTEDEFDDWWDEFIKQKIRSHPPKERLEIYLEWNGILGYTSRIWEITQGEL